MGHSKKSVMVQALQLEKEAAEVKLKKKNQPVFPLIIIINC